MDKVKVYKPKQTAVIMLPVMVNLNVSIALHPHQKWRCESESAGKVCLKNGCVKMSMDCDVLSQYFREVEF